MTYEKGDIIIYEYAFDIHEARVKEVYQDHVKVKDLGIFGETRVLPDNKIQGKRQTDDVWI